MNNQNPNEITKIRMWQEHCLKCLGLEDDCDHVVDLSTIISGREICKKHFDDLHHIAKDAHTTHKELQRYTRVSMMTDDDFAEIIGGATFQVAKTMPDNPHSYTLLKTWQNKELWFDIALYINMKAEIEMFGGQPFKVYYANNGYKYWSMDPTLESTDLINRKDEDADK